MTFLIGVLVGYGLCLFSVAITFFVGEGGHVQEEAFSDDPRPAILKEDAE